MSKVRLTGSTSGYTELTAPATAGNNTITLPSSNGSANQLLKNSGTAGALTWSSVTEDSSGNVQVNGRDLLARFGTTSIHLRTDGVNSFITNKDDFVSNGSTGNGALVITGQTAIRFQTGSAGSIGTEAMRITDTGLIGIGKTPDNSAFPLDIGVGTRITRSGASSYLEIGHGTTTDQAAYLDLVGDATHTDFGARLIRNAGANGNTALHHRGTGDLNLIGTDACAVNILTSNTIRSNINSSGQINNYSTTGGILQGLSTGAGTTTGAFVARHSSTSISTGTNAFIVWSNGNVVNTNNSYGALSDIKLKENIVDAGSQWSDLKALQVRNYNFKEETNQPTHRQIGLIAQEAEQVCPGLVYESPDRDEEGNDLGTVTKSINYSVLYMKAVKALQEAMERIESLEARLAALEANS